MKKLCFARSKSSNHPAGLEFPINKLPWLKQKPSQFTCCIKVIREVPHVFKTASGAGAQGGRREVGIPDSPVEALHAVFTNPVYFLFVFWMCFILSQLPFHLTVVPAKLMSVYAFEFLKHSQYLELQRMRLK